MFGLRHSFQGSSQSQVVNFSSLLLSILSVAFGVAHRLKVVSKRQTTPSIVVNDVSTLDRRVTSSSSSSPSTKLKKPLWSAREKRGVKFCSDMVTTYPKPNRQRVNPAECLYKCCSSAARQDCQKEAQYYSRENYFLSKLKVCSNVSVTGLLLEA